MAKSRRPSRRRDDEREGQRQGDGAEAEEGAGDGQPARLDREQGIQLLAHEGQVVRVALEAPRRRSDGGRDQGQHVAEERGRGQALDRRVAGQVGRGKLVAQGQQRNQDAQQRGDQLDDALGRAVEKVELLLLDLVEGCLLYTSRCV